MRQCDPFCGTIRNAFRGVLNRLRLEFADQGTYVCTEGPRMDTAVEVRKYSAYGGDLAGMTLAPEAFLARELEMCYASLCYVTNYAEGLMDRPYARGRAFEGLATRSEMRRVSRSFAYFPKIVARTVRRLKREKRVCHCQEAMRRYKESGMIGEDWREWLVP